MLQTLRNIFKSKKYLAPDGTMMTRRQLIAQASSYSVRFDENGDLTDLDAAIEYTTVVISAAETEKHPFLPEYLESLSAFYSLKFGRTGKLEELKAALKFLADAIDISESTDPELPRRYQSLGVTYGQLYREVGDVTDLNIALKYHHASVDSTPAGDDRVLVRKVNLSASYMSRYERFGNEEDLMTSLRYDLEAIESAKPDDIELPFYQQSLATSYGKLFELVGDLDSINSAVKYSKLSVEGTPPQDSSLSFRQQNLAMCYIRRFERTGDTEDLELSLAYNKAAIDGMADGDPTLAKSQHDLGFAYAERFRYFGNLEDLEKAVQHKKAAVNLTHKGHPSHPTYLIGLAATYVDRYRRLADPNDLDLALEHSEAAVEECPPTHPDRLALQHSLALAYVDRFEKFKNADDIAQALLHMNSAKDGVSTDHPDYPDRLRTLAVCYTSRYTHLGDLNDLVLAMTLREDALSLMPTDHADYPEVLYNIGSSHMAYYESESDTAHLELALEYFHKAIDNAPEGHAKLPYYQQNLAVAYSSKFTEDENEDSLQASAIYFRKVIHSPNTPPSLALRASKQFGDLAYNNNMPECVDAYQVGFNVLSQLIWLGNSISARHDTLVSHDIPRFAGVAAAASIRFDKPDLAVSLLEQGLAITYRQLLELKDNTADLADKHPKLAQKFKEISWKLQGLEGDSSSIQNSTIREKMVDLHGFAIERKKLLDEIRKLPGFEDLFMPRSYQYLSQVSSGGPVIMINCSSFRSDAIVIHKPKELPVVVNLPNLTIDDANAKLEKLRLALTSCNINSRSEDRYGRRFGGGSLGAKRHFEEIISWLRTSIVEPVFNVLYQKGIVEGRIWWCPSGPFTYLPLHAAGDVGPFIQSYTSTLDTLILARQKEVSLEEGDAMLLTALGVPELPNRPHMSLPCVRREITNVVNALGTNRVRTLVDSDANVDTVLEHIETTRWLHLACHGQQNLSKPLESGLILQDGVLELGKILRTSLPSAEFVYLSACQTAMGDSDLINEAMHLTGSLIAAGFQGAIGTLWSIADSDGPVVAETFYKRVLADKNTPDKFLAAEALRNAVQKLKDAGAPYERWMPFVHFGI